MVLAKLPHGQHTGSMVGGWAQALRGSRAAVVAWRANFTSLSSFLPLQLWCFWRRRLFIWISFMDSYFEILLYVRPHSSSFISKNTRRALEGRTQGQGAPREWNQSTGQTQESDSPPGACYTSTVVDHLPSSCYAPVEPELFTYLVLLNPHKCSGTITITPILQGRQLRPTGVK